MRGTFWVLAFSLLFVVCGATSLSASCSATQNCQGVPWIFSVSCSDFSGTACSSGPDWVECNGARTYCPTPAPCTGTCFSGPQCYAVCSEDGDPMFYPCDLQAHCCRCYY